MLRGMWTFRLRLHLRDGGTTDLFGPEGDLSRFRRELQGILERGRDETISYSTRNQTKKIRTGEIERIGDLEPIIPMNGFRRP